MLSWLRIVFLCLLASVFQKQQIHAQIKLPAIFTDSMVLQQKMPVPVWGETSCRSCRIEVIINQTTVKTKANKLGKWQVNLPAIKAGGPYTLIIKDEHQQIELKEILVGEVWLCSGQSNMEFKLKQSSGGKEEAESANFSSIRLFRMTARDEVRPTAKKIYSKQTLAELEQSKFYKEANWKSCNPQTAADFSAVAYYFGKQLHQQLNVPIGLISNAVGGTSTQAFINQEALKSHPQLMQFVRQQDGTPWTKVVKDIHPWLLERINRNLKNFSEEGKEIYPHPYAPSFLYESGIKPLIPFAIKGAIWYQGESNATHPEIHDELFKALVNNWRTEWKQGDFPFYYVQLPKISDRSRWPEFRESQARSCRNLNNIGMAVTIDTGDSLDVHPKEKKVVGERLALLALGKDYQKPVKYSGPVLENHIIHNEYAILKFKNAEELKTSNGKTVEGFVLFGYDLSGTRIITVKAEASIENNQLNIKIPKDIRLTSIQYAWVPYPECNLVNEVGLPAAPFKIEIPGNN